MQHIIIHVGQEKEWWSLEKAGSFRKHALGLQKLSRAYNKWPRLEGKTREEREKYYFFPPYLLLHQILWIFRHLNSVD